MMDRLPLCLIRMKFYQNDKIKRGKVKKALYDVFNEKIYFDNLCNAIAYGTLKALEQYNNGKEKEKPTE